MDRYKYGLPHNYGVDGMNVKQMRDAIYNAYPAPRWWRRVMNMHDDQVIAVYHKLLNSGKLDPKPALTNPHQFKPFVGKQLSMFD